MPMRVIGMLLGIPEADQQAVRERADRKLRREEGQPQRYDEHKFAGFDAQGTAPAIYHCDVDGNATDRIGIALGKEASQAEPGSRWTFCTG